MGDKQGGKVAFTIERLNRTGPDALAYRHDVPKLKRHFEQALKVMHHNLWLLLPCDVCVQTLALCMMCPLAGLRESSRSLTAMKSL